MRRRSSSWIALVTVGAVLASTTSDASDIAPDQADFFEKRIRPVLIQHCYECHSQESDSIKGGFLLDSREGIRAGGDSGAAIVPGDPGASLLLEAMRYESYEMPPDGKLPDEAIRDFERWIASGAPDPRQGDHANSPADQGQGVDTEHARRFWAFQPPVRQELPNVEASKWAEQRTDWFILQKIEEAGLEPSREAEKQVLIRRLYFALTGLPPLPDDVEAYLDDTSEHAYENLVERLLASPHFGEHFARLWLDVARYAEDQAHIVGSNKELFYPNAYLYRDWLIGAFNQDLPYDEFVRQQLAADLINSDESPIENRAALGFIGLGPKYYRRNAPEVMADEWEDRVDVVSRGLLGLTVACARCHDHKYDPIPTEDYYALAGVFASTEMFNCPLEEECETDKKGQAEDSEEAMHIVRDGEPTDLHVLIRGNVENKGDKVPRHFLSVLSDGEPRSLTTGSGRLDLAGAIVDADNPLTARVIVNRVWGMLIGKPLVRTPSNFGNLGEPPTHPELLDDLAVRFVESGWSLKWLAREIALSATFRQTSVADHSLQSKDPANRLLARMNRRRLSVEQWRDAILVSADQLDRSIGGRSIKPNDHEARRRTVYSEVSRFELNPMLAAFDFPDPNVHASRRNETTTSLQKLFMLNSPFMIAAAESFAERINSCECQSSENSEAERIRTAYRWAFNRDPSADEIEIAKSYLETFETDGVSSWREYAHVLLASNELLFVD